MKIEVRFKSVEPFFSQEKSGFKPFTIRKFDLDDCRFSSIIGAQPDDELWIEIYNPITHESFKRLISRANFLYTKSDWLLLFWEP